MSGILRLILQRLHCPEHCMFRTSNMLLAGLEELFKSSAHEADPNHVRYGPAVACFSHLVRAELTSMRTPPKLMYAMIASLTRYLL